jgi:hypothetical protein
MVYGKRQQRVVTVGAGHANHHFAEPTRDQHPDAHAWLNFDDQIKHKVAFLNKELETGRYHKVLLVGHSIGAYVCCIMYQECRLKERVDSELYLLLPYIRHSSLPSTHKKQLEIFHSYDPYSTWFVCAVVSMLALILPVVVKKFLVQQYAVLPPDVCPVATATQLFTPRMIFNHFIMVSWTQHIACDTAVF